MLTYVKNKGILNKVVRYSGIMKKFSMQNIIYVGKETWRIHGSDGEICFNTLTNFKMTQSSEPFRNFFKKVLQWNNNYF